VTPQETPQERREVLVEAIGDLGYRLVGALVEQWIAEARADERRDTADRIDALLMALIPQSADPARTHALHDAARIAREASAP
jgi:hypothetical protein